MAETLASSQDNVDVIKDTKNRIQVYEVDPDTGKKTHISHDKVLEDRGYDPADSAANYALRPPEVDPVVPNNPEIDALRSEMLEMMRQMEANNERRHQELMAVLQALVEQNRGAATPPGENLPPGSPVGDPEDEGMERIRTHFSMLDGEESEEDDDDDDDDPPPPPPPPPDPTPTPPGPEEGTGPTLAERLTASLAEVEAARDDLVRLTIRRRARSGDGLTDSRREDLEDYRSAMDTYRNCLDEYMTLRQQALETEGSSPSEQRRQLTQEMYEEQRRFVRRELSMNEELYQHELESGGIRAFKARVLRRWANMGTGKKLLIGLGVGAAAAIASGPLGLGLAGLAAGSAVKFSLGLLNRSASARNISERSTQQELARIDREARNSALHLRGAADMDEYTSGLVSENEGYLNERVRRAQRRNKIGNGILLASTAAIIYGGLELGGVAPRAPHLSELWSGGHGSAAGNSMPLHGGEQYTPIDLHGINPNTIYAHNPMQFQHGVLRLLHEQGIQTHGATPEKLRHMSEWMQSHPIASGMRNGPNGLEQNLTGFPHTGHEFVNANASAAEGFKIGTSGSGREALDQWIREAERSGMKFERVNR